MKPRLKLTFFIITFVLSFLKSYSQNIELKINSKDSVYNSVIDSIKYKSNHKSKKSAYKEIDSISNILSLNGFINNTYISEEKDSLISCYFNLNERIDTIRLYFTDFNFEKSFLKKNSIKIHNNSFDIPISKIQETINLLSTYIENKGYSFTKIFLTNLSLSNTIITAKLNINFSKKRTIDNIIVKGYTNFPKKYLTNYLNLNKNTLFNNNLLKRTQESLNTIPFITQIKNPEVLFTKDSTSLYLYLKKKSTSQFEGIIGFSNSKNNNRLNINGYLNLFLNNIINNGESISLNWKNNGNENTTLNLNVNTPYILKSKFSTSGTFNIYKQDSSFLNTTAKINIKYNINRNQAIGSVIKNENSTTTITSEVNEYESFTKNLFGVSYNYKPILIGGKNYFSLELEYLTGNKNNNTIKSKNDNAYLFAEYLFNLNSKNKILIKNTSELINTSNILENELFRIGGINSIRGFEDESLLASKYSITNLEYQFYTNPTNYLYTITDFAFTENNYLQSSDKLIGIGFGYNFKNENTNINISYVFGKTKKEALKLNNARLHIKISYNF